MDIMTRLAQQAFCSNQCIVSDFFVLKEKWRHLLKLSNKSKDDHIIEFASAGG
jgi:hypothetical protein